MSCIMLLMTFAADTKPATNQTSITSGKLQKLTSWYLIAQSLPLGLEEVTDLSRAEDDANIASLHVKGQSFTTD